MATDNTYVQPQDAAARRRMTAVHAHTQPNLRPLANTHTTESLASADLALDWVWLPLEWA